MPRNANIPTGRIEFAGALELAPYRAGRRPPPQSPDLVVLDLGLPDLDGIQVILQLRSTSQAPILVLSGRRDSADKVDALDAGADDYVTKPFGMDELLARLELCRAAPAPSR